VSSLSTQRRKIAIHGKNAVGRDQRARVAGSLLRQQRLHVREIAMAVGNDFRARKPRAGKQAGVRELIDEYQVIRAGERGNDAQICQIPRAEHAGIVGLLQARA